MQLIAWVMLCNPMCYVIVGTVSVMESPLMLTQNEGNWEGLFMFSVELWLEYCEKQIEYKLHL